MAINIPWLAATYFCFDEPVPYRLQNKQTITIYPVSLKDGFSFLYSYSILDIDKNSLPDVNIIQMSYLQYLAEYVCAENPVQKTMLGMLLQMCLHLQNPCLKTNEFGKIILVDTEQPDIVITGADFDDIKRIILYQNLPHYDDEYVNPELKQAMNEMDELKNKQYEMPSLERKMAIITAQTGLSKEEQKTMTLRSHSILFEEVRDGIDFITARPAAILSGHSNDIEHWIYRKKRNKFDAYVTDVDSYAQSMGNQHNTILQTSGTNVGNQHLQQFNNFNKK